MSFRGAPANPEARGDLSAGVAFGSKVPDFSFTRSQRVVTIECGCPGRFLIGLYRAIRERWAEIFPARGFAHRVDEIGGTSRAFDDQYKRISPAAPR